MVVLFLYKNMGYQNFFCMDYTEERFFDARRFTQKLDCDHSFMRCFLL